MQIHVGYVDGVVDWVCGGEDREGLRSPRFWL